MKDVKKDKKTIKKSEHIHHKHEDVLKLINIAKGHLQGIENMILQDKY